MKRIDVLKSKQEEKGSQDLVGVIRRDKLTLENVKSNLNLELLNIEQSIEQYLANKDAVLDSQFISLIELRETKETDIARINSIMEIYL